MRARRTVDSSGGAERAEPAATIRPDRGAAPSAGRPPVVSLIVTTYNRPDALELVLRSALRQRARPAEVLVADDGSGEETAAVVRGLAAAFAAQGIALHHVWRPDDGFRAAEIRNRAIAAAGAEYLVLIDGDCVLHPDFVRSHAAFARRGSFVQGTRVLLSPERTDRALAEGEARFGVFERGMRNRINALSLPWVSRITPSPRDPLRGVRSANMALWRDDAVLVNGFDERFVGWGREDSEFVARLLAAGRRRRKLQCGGIVYHLWHQERPRSDLEANDHRYEETVARRLVRCEIGLDRHLAAARSTRVA